MACYIFEYYTIWLTCAGLPSRKLGMLVVKFEEFILEINYSDTANKLLAKGNYISFNLK